MDKAYSRINWQNQPSTSTALGATNLNKMDVAVNEIDNRVVTMDTSKANLSVVNQLVKTIAFNPANGQFTITLQNGTTSVIDTAMEKIVTNFSYNSTTQKIDLILADGSTQSIDISAFVTNVDFATSETIQFYVDNDGKTKANIINGSITDEMLEPQYLSSITVQAQTATSQAILSKRYAVGGVETGDTTDNAKYYKDQAELFAGQAQAIAGVGIATNTVAGLVRGGGDVSVNADGTMSVNSISDISEEPVTFTEATEDGELTNGSTLAVLMGLIKKKFNDIVYALSGKIGTDKIISTGLLATTQPGFVPDAAAVADILNAQNNNLTNISTTAVGTITFESGFTADGSDNVLKKRNNVVSLSIRISGTIPVGRTKIATIPGAYFVRNKYGTCIDYSSSSNLPAVLEVSTDGGVYVRTSYAMTHLTGTVTYILDN